MPENDEQDISAAAQAPVETERERFERERLSRRQALKRFGMTSAMATFALFSVDDLARMVGKAMQQRAADNKVVEQVAREFQNAGVAFAAYPGDPNYTACSNCVATKNDCLANSADLLTACLKLAGSDTESQNDCYYADAGRYTGCEYSAIACCQRNHCSC